MEKNEIATIERDHQYTISIEGTEITLSSDEVIITSEDIPGWLVASENNITVALDITISDTLRNEGISRDIVNRIQNLRKEIGLEVQDKINVTYKADNELIDKAVKEIFKLYQD